MPDAAQVFVSGLALGFSIAAPPGPLNATAARQVAQRSWLAGWLTLLGATTADALFFLFTYYGLAAFMGTPEVRSALFVVGGVLMLYLAGSTALREKRGGGQAAAGGVAKGRSTTFPYLLGLTMGLTNPYQLAWWVAVGAVMVTDYGASVVLGFFTGILAWTLGFSAVVRAGISWHGKAYPLLVYASVVIMTAFGLWFLGSGLLALLSPAAPVSP